MSLKIHTLLRVLAGLCVAAGVLWIFPVSAASCLGGTVPIGSSRAEATAAGIPASAECWDPKNKYAGQDVGEAKRWLQQHATQNANISCLNADYAERVKKLMQANPNGIPTIRDGYRGQAAQAQALASGASKVGPCGSYHQYGMAADFDANQQSLRWMRENSSQYGLSPVTNANPTTGCTGSGFCDPGHIQIAGQRPAANQCGICSTDGGAGNGVLPPGAGGGMGGGGMGGGQGGGGQSGGGGQPSAGMPSTQQSQPTAQQQLPDDMRPYTPTTPGVCDAGYRYLNGQCHRYDLECPPGYRIVQATSTPTSTSTATQNGASGLLFSCEVIPSTSNTGTTQTNNTNSNTRVDTPTTITVPTNWPLRPELSGLIFGAPIRFDTANYISSPFSAAQNNAPRTLPDADAIDLHIPDTVSDDSTPRPRWPFALLSGDVSGLAPSNDDAQAPNDPSLVVAPLRSAGDTFGSNGSDPRYLPAPAGRGFFGSMLDRFRALFGAQR